MLALVQIPIYLGSIMFILAPFSLPFCAGQLALCRYCKSRYLRLALVVLGGVLALAGFCVFSAGGAYNALFGLFLLVPAPTLLTGCALGWLIWTVLRKMRIKR